MAIGDITDYVFNQSVELLASATATNAPPVDDTDGVAVSTLHNKGVLPESIGLLVYSTAGSDTMTVTCRLWGYHDKAETWFPIGIGAAAAKGVINGGAAIDETSADAIAHTENISLPKHFTRLYLEITNIGGTATAITAQLIVGTK